MENFYEILGAPENASMDDIKKAYREAAKKFHPDTGGSDDELFHAANRAYNVLSKPESRRDYDMTLNQFRQGTGAFDSYSADVYDISGDKILKALRELARQTGRLTRVIIKREGKVIIDMPFGTATAITAIGLILAPIATILINVGINSFFEMEVKNLVMDKYDEATRTQQTGDLNKAEKEYIEVLEMSEFFVPARLSLGLLYRQLGENRKAENCFKEVLKVAPFGEIGDVARTNLESIRGF